MGNCEVITKVDIVSDHRMVRARVEKKQEVNETKENPETKATEIRPYSVKN